MKKLLIAAALLFISTSSVPPARRISATYTATIANMPAGVETLNVWIPLPVSRGPQRVSDGSIDGPVTFRTMHEKEFGNDYAFASIQHPPAGDFTVRVHFTAERREETMQSIAETKASKRELDRALRADKLVTLSPRVRKLAQEVTAGKEGPIDEAHAIYDHLLATMKYDKTIAGWGHGDTERACDLRAGNCTDFHSLFMSLA